MRWFGRARRWDVDLYVEITPEAFIFRSKRETFHMAAEAGPNTAAGMGRALGWKYQPPSAPLPLFTPARAGEPAQARYPHLRALLHEAFVRAVGPGLIRLKPRVVLHGAASLDTLLHGYQYELLRRAALEAEARSVRFTEKAPLAPPPGYEMPVNLGDVWMEAHGRRLPGKMLPGIRKKRRFRRLRRGSGDDG